MSVSAVCLIRWEKKLVAVENEEKVIVVDLDKNYVNEVRDKVSIS